MFLFKRFNPTPAKVGKALYVTLSSPIFQPRHPIRRPRNLNASPYGPLAIGSGDGLDISQFGSYQLVVPQILKVGVGKVDVDQLVPQGVAVAVKDAVTILNMRGAGKLAKDALALAGSLCVVGKPTLEIDATLRRFITGCGAYPSPLNYRGFPNSVCTSVNNVICHGIPDGRRLQDGDLINVDITVGKRGRLFTLGSPKVEHLEREILKPPLSQLLLKRIVMRPICKVYLNGVHADTSATFLVGAVDRQGRELVEHTRRSLELGIQVCGPNVPFSEIGRTIERYASEQGYAISKDLAGHGIGSQFHEAPLILHHDNFEEGRMASGMTFTIEPILCQGVGTGTFWPDGWTIVTEDGGRAAQFEHTVLITPDGVDILTA
ncbi:hypothetical protein L0F63_001401 [Massospora cicadina]|nr:hypothetical protein L0F63_001401 [Massospora cicadina]